MRILDAPSLLSAVEQRSKVYRELRDEMQHVKKALKSVSGLGDEFTGKGADNIKAFYEDLALYTDTYLDFIDMQKAFLDGIKGKLDDESLGGSTFIDEHFLDAQLKQGIQNNKDMVKEQKEALSTIFDDISDLIELNVFSSKEVNEHLDDANKKRKDAIEAVHKIDNELKTEYAKSEAIEKHLATFYAKMMAATGKGKNAQPMYYDAKAFHETDVYKNHDKIDAQVKAYLKVKKEEKEKRRIKELKEKLNDPSCISEEKYFEIVDEIGYENLSYDQKMYYSQLLQFKAQEEASEGFVDVVKGAAVGLYDVAKDTVVGIYDLVTDPRGAVESVVTAVSHPIETSKAIGKAISDSYERDMVNGDSYSRAHWVSYATGTIATSIFGTKGLGSVSKTGVTTTKTAVVSGVNKTKDFANNISIYDLLPYSPKHQLAGIANVPYNVVDGASLKERLVMLAEGIKNPRTRLPRSNGRWEGVPGNGKWYSDNPKVKAVTGGKPVEFIDNRPNFTPWEKGRLHFKEGKLTGEKSDFSLVYKKLKKQYGFKSQHEAKEWLVKVKLTPHHLDNKTIQLVPTDLHKNVPHIGAASDLRGGY
ncbi:T7SS effector LXG polymorphic toxin [Bacillus safensis]|uniref:T7SS effector LXG polymorphic toxin n=1 Tax=Bacillus safensis TaxID=561879 RepID=UPI003A843703